MARNVVSNLLSFGLFLLLQGCVSSPTAVKAPPSSLDSECPPPIKAFTAVGIDVKASQSTFEKLVFGGIEMKTSPQVIWSASEAMRNAEVQAYLDCIAFHKYGYSREDLIWLQKRRDFLMSKPSPEQIMEWEKQNPVPTRSINRPSAKETDSPAQRNLGEGPSIRVKFINRPKAGTEEWAEVDELARIALKEGLAKTRFFGRIIEEREESQRSPLEPTEFTLTVEAGQLRTSVEDFSTAGGVIRVQGRYQWKFDMQLNWTLHSGNSYLKSGTASKQLPARGFSVSGNNPKRPNIVLIKNEAQRVSFPIISEAIKETCLRLGEDAVNAVKRL